MSLYGALAENTRRNERVERGQATVTGSLVVTVPGPLKQITNAFVTINQSTAPGLDPILATVSIGTGANANQITISLWKATSSANPTLIASTTPTLVDWMVFGNLSAGQGF